MSEKSISRLLSITSRDMWALSACVDEQGKLNIRADDQIQSLQEFMSRDLPAYRDKCKDMLIDRSSELIKIYNVVSILLGTCKGSEIAAYARELDEECRQYLSDTEIVPDSYVYHIWVKPIRGMCSMEEPRSVPVEVTPPQQSVPPLELGSPRESIAKIPPTKTTAPAYKYFWPIGCGAIGFSDYTLALLTGASITRVIDLVNRTREELMTIKDIGPIRVESIEKCLDRHGLHLGMNVDSEEIERQLTKKDASELKSIGTILKW